MKEEEPIKFERPKDLVKEGECFCWGDNVTESCEMCPRRKIEENRIKELEENRVIEEQEQ